MPNGWGLGKSESGWMTGESFFEYVSNIFYPWIIKNNIPLPVIFYVDGHKSHLTLHVSDFCSEKGIILISLYPNSTHLIQPLDVGVFKALKNGWKKAVSKFRIESNKQKIRNENFAPLLDSVIKEVITSKIMQNAFRTCGLFPFDANAIEYEKLVTGEGTSDGPENITNNPVPTKVEFNSQHLQFVESLIENDKMEKFKDSLVSENEWSGPTQDESLYLLWKKLNMWTKNLQLCR